ncbi:4-(cytidine 5'-diphospho)-2-C-methyl-D-erythritol kinase [Halorhodospira halochloris]|uniref:4-(cytidine 5'-diphospho)-2-C-methyl-D-erythritol kinase n=1 Tax=Halorhodospira halochloris TaxID=1052 RepID=UPI001EE8053B|nr:4-(cytidine 5'-diphospho)-2-C-methyl-D-erythritol kinase [Halorhodospira halochloris]MCG5529380.1 4-(cytidine 5'-diphospho)-2-C-methyl-D-erythritol kinase [Halorhodospira halochloris]MCG5547355.1 4-(cytidine 5'-diphospho)-2-C-methyl-D-erythritol kinase [Halorhodospira halochloris]
MSEWSSWSAPAKINLFLHVLGRREDGYHELQTAFQLLDHCDVVHLRRRDDTKIIRCNDIPGVAAEDDLTVRAARALQAAAGTCLGADIWLEKRLPAGGGLGGGSSDAATALLALDYIWGLGFGRDRLAQIGLGLGADVPVFVRGYSAWAQGVGEILEPLPERIAESQWYLVVDPGVAISTAQVFCDPRLTRDTLPIKIRDLLAGDARNDCESVVRTHWPEVESALEWLSSHGRARMSGTGACCFVPFGDEAEAREALGSMPSKWGGFVSRGTAKSAIELELAQARA